MSTEQQLREHYQDTAVGMVDGPDLRGVVKQGRRRRRARLTAVVATATAAVSVGAVVTASLAGGGAQTSVTDPTRGADAADAPKDSVAAPEDFVAGTDIDDTLQQVVAAHLPALGAPDDVYPSDWYANGPIPDADFADATDWQAAYPIADGERALVLMGYPDPAEPAGCPQCDQETVPQGTLMTQTTHLQATGEWLFMTSLVRDDGFTVSVLDYVAAAGLAPAREARSISGDDAASVVRDPRMEFPAPLTPPAGP